MSRVDCRYSGAARATTVALVSVLASSCMTSRVEEAKNNVTGIDAGESVVILATSYHKNKPTEGGFVDCVADRVQQGPKPVKVFSDQKFRDALFPWFEPRTMPQSPESIPELLAHPGVADRIESNGIRYLVWLNGTTERTNGGGSLACAIGPGGGGCFGFGWWEDQARYQAAIWDMRQKTAAGTVSADVHGTSMIPALVIPIPLIARTQTAACKGLVKELQQFITDSGPPT